MVERLTARRLETALATAQVSGRLPSVAAGVVRDHELAWTSGDPDLQYRIGSITKTLTTVLVLQLRNEGLLSLADPLEKHLPGVGYGDRSIRALLSHSSGMQSEPEGPWWERAPGVTFAELAASIDTTKGPFESGETFHYTNLAFGLLGEVVGRLRGRSWWECVSERVLEPLGMTRTSYHPVAPHAQGFSVHPYLNTLTEEPHQDTGAMAAAGQAWSTVEDLGRYATFLVEGHPAVLPAETIAEMSTPQAGSLSDGLSSGYGLGLRLVAHRGRTLVGHTGSMPGFQASLFVDRPRRTGAVVLANSTTGLASDSIAPALLEVIEDSEPSAPPPWRPAESVPDEVADLAGVWHWGNTGFVFTWYGAEVVVTSLRTGEERDRFRPAGDGTFVGTSGYHHGETLRLVRSPNGEVDHLLVATFVFTRAPYDPRAPIPGGAP
ncbi:MAG TPA: serine hydrolase domain-containing protein [Nocardioidaceae bacterium]|nr:serine hydrolase domain-containing protein [Nocardioidaceae bacterium]